MADFNGTNGRDVFRGDPWSDHAWGYGGRDMLFGYDASDALMGGAGNDYLYGGRGADNIEGGLGADNLYGGTGGTFPSVDDFIYRSVAESPARRGKADIIRDWNHREDDIWLSMNGSVDYGEARTRAGTIDGARAQAERSLPDDINTAFLHNPVRDIGFFLYDHDRNGSFEMGVILLGAGSAANFSYYNLF